MKKPSEIRNPKGVVRPANHKPRRPTRKRLGELAELAFMCKAASLGFGVAKPYGDSERFDFIVSRDGRLWRVQVKSTRTAYRGACEIGAHGCWGGRDTYTKDEIDLIAAYVVPEKTWYLIPIEATRGRKRLCLLRIHEWSREQAQSGQAHLAHPALGERFTVSPTESCLSE